MADGQLEGVWSQLLYAKRTLISPARLVLKVTLFLLLHCTGVFLCFWGVLTRLDLRVSSPSLQHQKLLLVLLISFLKFIIGGFF